MSDSKPDDHDSQHGGERAGVQAGETRVGWVGSRAPLTAAVLMRRTRGVLPGSWPLRRPTNPLPAGSATVGVWLVMTGLVTYGFLAIAARALGPEEYGALATMWALSFISGPGFFLPVEQEVGRAISSRRALGMGVAPLVRRAALAAGGLAAVLSLVAVAAGPWIVPRLFDGNILLLVGFVVLLFGYAAEHLTRGVLAGAGKFRPYGALLGAEGLTRLVVGVGFAAAGVASAGPYGVLVGVAPILACVLVAPRARATMSPGPTPRWSELTSALAYLLIGSVLAQVIVNGAPVAAQLLVSDKGDGTAGRLLAGLAVARVPLYLFQSVQAALLPELVRVDRSNRPGEFRRGLLRVLFTISVVGVLATMFGALLGPWGLRTFFGASFHLSAGDMAILSAASSIFMIAMTLAQPIVARSAHWRMAVAWAIGSLGFFAGLLASSDTLLRCELAYLGGALAAAVAMLGMLASRSRGGVSYLSV